MELLIELSESGDHVRRSAWKISLGERPVGVMVSSPLTFEEAETAARWRWPQAEVSIDA
ncbi:hypothetical protein D9M71_713690 [compost metagenome]